LQISDYRGVVFFTVKSDNYITLKIGVLSDIHGNSYAMDRVLIEARKESIDKLLILGDLVGYYYYPEKVLKSLSEWDYEIIRGNHEVLLEELIIGQADMNEVVLKYGSGHISAIEKLSNRQITDLTTANTFSKLSVDGIVLSMYHGSSFDPNQYIYPDTDVSILNKCDDGSEFVFIGHSHYPFIHKNNNGLLINVGSVGQSRVMGGVASWCILNTITRVIEMRATPYDTVALIKDVEDRDPNVIYMKKILQRNIF
jgi:putative phosphoesterase